MSWTGAQLKRPAEEALTCMSTAFALVFASALMHAYWNYLLKRSGGTQVFVALSKLSEAAVLLPLLFIMCWSELPRLLHAWHLPLVGATLVLANYLSLSAAYRAGDLSFAYPISRAGILVFLPPLAFVTLHERPAPPGLFAIGLAIAGIVLVALPDTSRRALRGFAHSFATRSAGFSLMAAFAAACYTIWDKRSIQTLTPFAYFAAYSTLVAIMYAVVALRSMSFTEIASEWRQQRGPILQVALLNSCAYLLVLVALRTTTSSYVIAARQLSIAIGALLGWRLLGERLVPHKAVGIVVLVVACMLVAVLGDP